MSDESWYRLECLVENADSASDVLWEVGAGGVEVQDRETFMEGGAIAPVPEGRSRLIAFFDLSDRAEFEALREILEERLSPDALRLDRFEDTSWQTAWKDYFHPVRLSERVIVGPPWEDFDAPEGGHKIVIEPGLAFGTGTHETTQLVGRLLDEIIGNSAPDTLLDVGCGSAILSMQARCLGVESVIGVDVDETAVGIARQTVALNELDGIELSTTPVGEIEDDFPVVVANILGHILVAIRDDLVARTRRGGNLVVSGVTTEQADAFESEFCGSELVTTRRDNDGDWVAFVFERSG